MRDRRPLRWFVFDDFVDSHVDATYLSCSDAGEPMEKPPRELPARRCASASPGTRPRLLLVEDDDALRSALVRSLNRSFDVTAAADGSAAAELLLKETFDGVLSDIGLPGMSGVDLLRFVRSYDVDVPVVLMTGQPSAETAVAALELGALTYVQKPFAHDEVQGTLLRAAKLARIARAKREAEAAGVSGSPLAGDRPPVGLVGSRLQEDQEDQE